MFLSRLFEVIAELLNRKPIGSGEDHEPTAQDMYSTDYTVVDSSVIYAAMPGIETRWIEPIQTVFRRFNITGLDAALLLAHIGHESNDLRRLEENLNYTAQRLMQVWPSRFRTIEHAREFERNPEKLANAVYGGRMGNNSIGDGWRFRGRGPIQITGRDNYTRLARDTGTPALYNPDILITDMDAGITSACWFWNTYVHSKTIEGSTRNINGGLNGLADREQRFNRAKALV